MSLCPVLSQHQEDEKENDSEELGSSLIMRVVSTS